MTILFSCNHCGQLLGVNAVVSGFTIACPKCQGRVRIPMNSMTDDIINIDYQDVIDSRSPRSLYDTIPHNESLEREKQRTEQMKHSKWAWQRYETKFCKSPIEPNAICPE